MTPEQQRAIALARARQRKAEAERGKETGRGHDVPAFVPVGVEGYDPVTGMVRRNMSAGTSAAYGAADATTFGFGDELAAGAGYLLDKLPGGGGKDYSQILSEMRGLQSQASEQNPKTYLAGQIGGGLAQAIAAAPASLSAQLTTRATPILGRMAAGAADGMIYGGLYGAGSGQDAASRAQGAALSALAGGAVGGVVPLASAGLSRAYEAARNAIGARSIARQAGTTPETLRTLGSILDADGSLGPQGQANMARAGQEAMLVDAGPTARRALDTAIQRSGPGARVARDAVQARIGRETGRLSQALDDTLGAPQGVTATRTAIRTGSAAARSSAYDDAYNAAINYADPQGQTLERLIKTRVPQSAINRANELMRTEGNESRQILARVADDGTVAFERLPDVRQIDYITRGLNDLAEAGEGAGAMGGQNALGRAYQNLSREIRGNLRDLVPEYGTALETAADPIRRSQAVDLGSRILSPSMTRDQVAEAVQGMTGPERQALAQGIRSQIDDAMANVSRTVQDGDVPAREAISALKRVSTRANREKLALAIGEEQADRLFAEMDRIATSFDIRASVADNSATYARQAMEQRFKTQPGVVQTAARGSPINATQRMIQALTGQTDDALRAREDAMYGDVAGLLTRPGGAGQGIYDAINQIGQTDQATRLMQERIFRALVGPRISYPAAVMANDRRTNR